MCFLVNDKQLTSYGLKWTEADIFSSDDDDDDGDKELNVFEEYFITDDEGGIVLTERRFLSNDVR